MACCGKKKKSSKTTPSNHTTKKAPPKRAYIPPEMQQALKPTTSRPVIKRKTDKYKFEAKLSEPIHVARAKLSNQKVVKKRNYRFEAKLSEPVHVARAKLSGTRLMGKSKLREVEIKKDERLRPAQPQAKRARNDPTKNREYKYEAKLSEPIHVARSKLSETELQKKPETKKRWTEQPKNPPLFSADRIGNKTETGNEEMTLSELKRLKELKTETASDIRPIIHTSSPETLPKSEQPETNQSLASPSLSDLIDEENRHAKIVKKPVPTNAFPIRPHHGYLPKSKPKPSEPSPSTTSGVYHAFVQSTSAPTIETARCDPEPEPKTASDEAIPIYHAHSTAEPKLSSSARGQGESGESKSADTETPVPVFHSYATSNTGILKASAHGKHEEPTKTQKVSDSEFTSLKTGSNSTEYSLDSRPIEVYHNFLQMDQAFSASVHGRFGSQNQMKPALLESRESVAERGESKAEIPQIPEEESAAENQNQPPPPEPDTGETTDTDSSISDTSQVSIPHKHNIHILKQLESEIKEKKTLQTIHETKSTPSGNWYERDFKEEKYEKSIRVKATKSVTSKKSLEEIEAGIDESFPSLYDQLLEKKPDSAEPDEGTSLLKFTKQDQKLFDHPDDSFSVEKFGKTISQSDLFPSDFDLFISKLASDEEEIQKSTATKTKEAFASSKTVTLKEVQSAKVLSHESLTETNPLNSKASAHVKVYEESKETHLLKTVQSAHVVKAKKAGLKAKVPKAMSSAHVVVKEDREETKSVNTAISAHVAEISTDTELSDAEKTTSAHIAIHKHLKESKTLKSTTSAHIKSQTSDKKSKIPELSESAHVVDISANASNHTVLQESSSAHIQTHQNLKESKTAHNTISAHIKAVENSKEFQPNDAESAHLLKIEHSQKETDIHATSSAHVKILESTKHHKLPAETTSAHIQTESNLKEVKLSVKESVKIRKIIDKEKQIEPHSSSSAYVKTEQSETKPKIPTKTVSAHIKTRKNESESSPIDTESIRGRELEEITDEQYLIDSASTRIIQTESHKESKMLKKSVSAHISTLKSKKEMDQPKTDESAHVISVSAKTTKDAFPPITDTSSAYIQTHQNLKESKMLHKTISANIRTVTNTNELPASKTAESAHIIQLLAKTSRLREIESTTSAHITHQETVVESKATKSEKSAHVIQIKSSASAVSERKIRSTAPKIRHGETNSAYGYRVTGEKHYHAGGGEKVPEQRLTSTVSGENIAKSEATVSDQHSSLLEQDPTRFQTVLALTDAPKSPITSTPNLSNASVLTSCTQIVSEVSEPRRSFYKIPKHGTKSGVDLNDEEDPILDTNSSALVPRQRRDLAGRCLPGFYRIPPLNTEKSAQPETPHSHQPSPSASSQGFDLGPSSGSESGWMTDGDNDMDYSQEEERLPPGSKLRSKKSLVSRKSSLIPIMAQKSGLGSFEKSAHVLEIAGKASATAPRTSDSVKIIPVFGHKSAAPISGSVPSAHVIQLDEKLSSTPPPRTSSASGISPISASKSAAPISAASTHLIQLTGNASSTPTPVTDSTQPHPLIPQSISRHIHSVESTHGNELVEKTISGPSLAVHFRSTAPDSRSLSSEEDGHWYSAEYSKFSSEDIGLRQGDLAKLDAAKLSKIRENEELKGVDVEKSGLWVSAVDNNREISVWEKVLGSESTSSGTTERVTTTTATTEGSSSGTSQTGNEETSGGTTTLYDSSGSTEPETETEIYSNLPESDQVSEKSPSNQTRSKITIKSALTPKPSTKSAGKGPVISVNEANLLQATQSAHVASEPASTASAHQLHQAASAHIPDFITPSSASAQQLAQSTSAHVPESRNLQFPSPTTTPSTIERSDAARTTVDETLVRALGLVNYDPTVLNLPPESFTEVQQQAFPPPPSPTTSSISDVDIYAAEHLHDYQQQRQEAAMAPGSDSTITTDDSYTRSFEHLFLANGYPRVLNTEEFLNSEMSVDYEPDDDDDDDYDEDYDEDDMTEASEWSDRTEINSETESSEELDDRLMAQLYRDMIRDGNPERTEIGTETDQPPPPQLRSSTTSTTDIDVVPDFVADVLLQGSVRATVEQMQESVGNQTRQEVIQEQEITTRISETSSEEEEEGNWFSVEYNRFSTTGTGVEKAPETDKDDDVTLKRKHQTITQTTTTTTRIIEHQDQSNQNLSKAISLHSANEINQTSSQIESTKSETPPKTTKTESKSSLSLKLKKLSKKILQKTKSTTSKPAVSQSEPVIRTKSKKSVRAKDQNQSKTETRSHHTLSESSTKTEKTTNWQPVTLLQTSNTIVTKKESESGAKRGRKVVQSWIEVVPTVLESAMTVSGDKSEMKTQKSSNSIVKKASAKRGRKGVQSWIEVVPTVLESTVSVSGVPEPEEKAANKIKSSNTIVNQEGNGISQLEISGFATASTQTNPTSTFSSKVSLNLKAKESVQSLIATLYETYCRMPWDENNLVQLQKVREIGQILWDNPITTYSSTSLDTDSNELVFFEPTGTATQTIHVPDLILSEKSETELSQLSLPSLVGHGILLLYEESECFRDLRKKSWRIEKAAEKIAKVLMEERESLLNAVATDRDSEGKILVYELPEIRRRKQSSATQTEKFQNNQTSFLTQISTELSLFRSQILSLWLSNRSSMFDSTAVARASDLIISERKKLAEAKQRSISATSYYQQRQTILRNFASQYRPETPILESVPTSENPLLINHVCIGFSLLTEELESAGKWEEIELIANKLAYLLLLPSNDEE